MKKTDIKRIYKKKIFGFFLSIMVLLAICILGCSTVLPSNNVASQPLKIGDIDLSTTKFNSVDSLSYTKLNNPSASSYQLVSSYTLGNTQKLDITKINQAASTSTNLDIRLDSKDSSTLKFTLIQKKINKRGPPLCIF